MKGMSIMGSNFSKISLHSESGNTHRIWKYISEETPLKGSFCNCLSDKNQSFLN